MRIRHVTFLLVMIVLLLLIINILIGPTQMNPHRELKEEIRLIDLRNELAELNKKLDNLNRNTDETFMKIVGPDENSADINSLVQYAEDGRVQIQLYKSKIAIIVEPPEIVFSVLKRKIGYLVPVNFGCSKDYFGNCVAGRPYMLYVGKLLVKSIAWVSLKNNQKYHQGVIKKVEKNEMDIFILIDLWESMGIEVKISSSDSRAIKDMKDLKEGDRLLVNFPRSRPYEVRIGKNKFIIVEVRESDKTAS